MLSNYQDILFSYLLTNQLVIILNKFPITKPLNLLFANRKEVCLNVGPTAT